jgi:hypothetical protein
MTSAEARSTATTLVYVLPKSMRTAREFKEVWIKEFSSQKLEFKNSYETKQNLAS